MDAVRLVWVEDALAVVDKPAGLSLATRRREPGAAVGRLLAAADSGEVAAWGLDPARLHLVHRLDVGTSGLVLLARDEPTHRALAAALAERRVAKTYLALVWGRPRPAEGRWDVPLGPDRRDRRRMAADPGGRRAVTAWRVLAHPPHASLLALHPETGRTHQIRVHCAHAGHPIVGDDLYGGARERGVREPALRAALTAGRPLLHAWCLELPEVPDVAVRRLTAPLPADFRGVLNALGVPEPEPSWGGPTGTPWRASTRR